MSATALPARHAMSRAPLERLGDVVEFTRRPPGLRRDGPVPFLPMAGIPAGGGVVNELILRERGDLKGARYFEAGDFLLATITPCFQNGKQAVIGDIVGGWGLATTEVLAMRSPALLPEYLAHLFRMPAVHQTLLTRMAGATGRMRIPRSAVQDLRLPIPGVEEQLDLVARLDALGGRVATGVGALRRALDEAPRLRQSLLASGLTGRLDAGLRAGGRTAARDSGAALLKDVLATRTTEALAIGARVATAAGVSADNLPAEIALPRGWTWASLDELALQIQYGTSSKAGDDPSGIPILRMGNVQNGDLNWGKLKYLPADHEAFPALLLREGDVLFNRTNSPELVGKSALVRDLARPASFASYLIRVALHPAVEPAWVSYWLNSPFGRRWARVQASQQVGQANINGRKLRAMAIPLPGRGEQARICALLDDHLGHLSASVAELEGATASATRLHQRLLGQVFAEL
jgi:type I restriction enzyme, S subunit